MRRPRRWRATGPACAWTDPNAGFRGPHWSRVVIAGCGTAPKPDTVRPREATSLPLDRRRRLRGDVEHHAVDGGDLVHDPRGARLDEVVRQARPVGGHGVVGGDGADGDRVAVGT